MVNAQTNTVTGKITDGVETLYGVNVLIQGTTTGVSTGPLLPSVVVNVLAKIS